MSSATDLTWATMSSGETDSTALTPTVFWAVIAVIAVIPWTPQRAKAFRSAWMPAPPPESEPAIERTAGTGLSLTLARSALVQISRFARCAKSQICTLARSALGGAYSRALSVVRR